MNAVRVLVSFALVIFLWYQKEKKHLLSKAVARTLIVSGNRPRKLRSKLVEILHLL